MTQPRPAAFVKTELDALSVGDKIAYICPQVTGTGFHESTAFVVENTTRQLILNRYLPGSIKPTRVRWSKSTNSPVGDTDSPHYLAPITEDET